LPFAKARQERKLNEVVNVEKKFETWCRKHFKSDYDKIDVTSHYDSSLTTSENEQQFKAKFPLYFIPEVASIKEAEAQLQENLLADNTNELQNRFGIKINRVS